MGYLLLFLILTLEVLYQKHSKKNIFNLPNKSGFMGRRGDSGFVPYIIGFIGLTIYTLSEVFKGNFIPILVVMGIILVIYIFVKLSEFKQHNETKDKINTDENPQNDFNFPRFILILLLLGFFIGGFFFNKSSSSNVENETVPVEEPMLTPETIDSASTVTEVPKEVLWIKKDFVNTSFQIPDNLVFIDSLSSDNSRLFIDFDSNISMTIVADLLNDEMKDKTINDLEDKISILANAITEENKRNFDDFKLLNYEMSNLGNSKAIKIEESSKKVSGLKNIEMKIISYHIISKPYYYKVNFCYPIESSEFSETFEQVNKTFDFNNSSDKENNSTINNNELGYYTVNPNSIDKVYFYDNPDERFKRKGYLIGNEVVFVQEIVNGFGYIDYTNIRGLKSKGWIKMICLLKSEN